MGKKIQSNFNSATGTAEFSKNALQSFSARLRFSPELTYVMPAQYAFAHKLEEPYEFNGRTYNTINSFLMLGVDSEGDCVDIKVVPASNLSRMFFDQPDVDAIEKDGHIRGAIKMTPASNIAEHIHSEDMKRFTKNAIAYKVSIQKVYVPNITGDATNGYDFAEKDGKLLLDPKEVAIFEGVKVPTNSNYQTAIPEGLKEYMK
jgi:hypothetical protein